MHPLWVTLSQLGDSRWLLPLSLVLILLGPEAARALRFRWAVNSSTDPCSKGNFSIRDDRRDGLPFRLVQPTSPSFHKTLSECLVTKPAPILQTSHKDDRPAT